MRERSELFTFGGGGGDAGLQWKDFAPRISLSVLWNAGLVSEARSLSG